MWKTSNSSLDIDNLVILWYHYNFLIQHYSSLFLFLLKFICLVSMFFFFFLFFYYCFFFFFSIFTFWPSDPTFLQPSHDRSCFWNAFSTIIFASYFPCSLANNSVQHYPYFITVSKCLSAWQFKLVYHSRCLLIPPLLMNDICFGFFFLLSF